MNEYFNQESEKEKRRHLRNTMRDAEVIPWSRLKGRQLLGCKFRRQHSVGVYVIDFYSPEIRLAIELDGDSHFREGAREYDDQRTQFIEWFRISVVRILNSDVYHNLGGILEMIGNEVLKRRGEAL